MMGRAKCWVGSLAVLLAAGCASTADGGAERCEDGRCARDTPGVSGGSGDDGSGDGSGSPGLGDFGNPDDVVPQEPMAGADPGEDPMAGPAGDPQECESGMFCASNDPDPTSCGKIRFDVDVEVTRTPGNVLLVFDRSSSMDSDWNGQRRWEAAADAITNALQGLSADLNQAGAVFFPTPDPNAMPVCIDPTGIACIFAPFLMVSPGSCGVGAMGDGQQIGFQAGTDFLATFVGSDMAKPYAPVPGGFTPLKEGLLEAQAALAASTLDGATSVVIITDGEPNCEWDDPTAQQIVTDWLGQGIQTHVIGLPGVQGEGPTLLNSLAASGGTDMFITPNDPAALEKQLASIVSESVRTGFNSCSIKLNPAADVPDELLMIVDEPGVGRQRVERDQGWALNGAGDQVEISGPLCDDAKAGRFASITFEYACPEVPPPPPIPDVR